jgi:hypothetical protein
MVKELRLGAPEQLFEPAPFAFRAGGSSAGH